MFISPWIKELINLALKEDVGSGDITTGVTVPPGIISNARIIAREEGIVAGLELSGQVFMSVDEGINYKLKLADGDRVKEDDLVAEISGEAASILTAERTALNFLQHMSGIATITNEWSQLIKDYKAQLVDTRKTTPGLRHLEKYAVRVGGGRNHRHGLDSGVLIKENHIVAAGGIRAAVERAREKAPITLRVEIEVTSLEELEEAIEAGADLIMLDNMEKSQLEKAVEINKGRALLEASGNITTNRLPEVAATGVDFISCGALTHSFRALDFSLLFTNK